MTLADLLNAPTELTLDGKTYKLRQPTVLEEATFSRWLEQLARESAARAVDIPEEQQRQLLRDVNADIAAGVYAVNGPVYVASLQSPARLPKYLSVILADQGCDEATARKLAERFLGEVVATLLSGHHDPKTLAVVLAKLGLPPNFLSSYKSSRTRPSTTGSTTSADSPDSSSANSTATPGTTDPKASPG